MRKDWPAKHLGRKASLQILMKAACLVIFVFPKSRSLLHGDRLITE